MRLKVLPSQLIHLVLCFLTSGNKRKVCLPCECVRTGVRKRDSGYRFAIAAVLVPGSGHLIKSHFLSFQKNKWETVKDFTVNDFSTKRSKLAWHHTGRNSMLGTHHVYGLEPNAEHKLTIVASNKHGSSEAVSTQFKTPENSSK